jgi:uncharacterized protein (DUF2141 family)
MKKIIVLVTLLVVLAVDVFADNTSSAITTIPTTIEINGIEVGKGAVYVAVSSNKKDYDAHINYTAFILESDAATMFHYLELPEGEYVVTSYQDSNGNNELDTGIFGIPIEPFGFTRYMGGVPGNFDKLKVSINAKNSTLRIILGEGVSKRIKSVE